MLVDDDADLLFVLKFQLKKEGYNIFTNLGGNNLVEQLQDVPVDLILLDLTMNMISGKELCKQIKRNKQLSKITVLIMSGNHDIEKVAGECGAEGFVGKPLSFTEVCDAIEKHV